MRDPDPCSGEQNNIFQSPRPTAHLAEPENKLNQQKVSTPMLPSPWSQLAWLYPIQAAQESLEVGRDSVALVGLGAGR